jgi:hypothetical protein
MCGIETSRTRRGSDSSITREDATNYNDESDGGMEEGKKEKVEVIYQLKNQLHHHYTS